MAASELTALSTTLARRRRAFDRANALERQKAAAMRQRGIFGAAAMNRLNADWIMSYQSADWELRGDLRTMRLRARQLLRDSPFARRYVELCADNIIGPHGVTLQVRAETTRGQFHTAHNEALEEAWARWGRLGACTADGRYSWHDVEEMAVKLWKGEGECFIQLLPGFPNAFGFAVQILDPDQIDENYNVPAGADGREVRMGVEIDRYGRPTAYYVWRHHPSEPQRDQQRLRVPADLMIHLYDAQRAGQTRGYPALATVQPYLRMLDATDEAVLVNLRVAASKMGFFTYDETKGGQPLEAPDGQAAIPMEAEPAQIPVLPAGYAFTAWDTGQPPAEYDPFSKSQLRRIAVGLGVSYASLSGDYSAANYSSERAAQLVERDHWRTDQRMVVEHLHERVFPPWLQHAALAGAVSVPGYDLARYGAHVWQPKGFDWVDPEKDMRAGLMEVAAGAGSLTRLCAQKGRDFEEILRERAAEEALAKELGVTLTLAQPTLPKTKLAADGEETPQEDSHADATSGRAIRVA